MEINSEEPIIPTKITGIELLKSPDTTAEDIAKIISKACPPVYPAKCDLIKCRYCWLSWLTGDKSMRATRDEKGEINKPILENTEVELKG